MDYRVDILVCMIKDNYNLAYDENKIRELNEKTIRNVCKEYFEEINELEEENKELKNILYEKLVDENNFEYDRNKSCNCGNNSKSLKDFKLTCVGWCYEGLTNYISYKCVKCGKENSTWDNVKNGDILIKYNVVKDTRPDKYKYKF